MKLFKVPEGKEVFVGEVFSFVGATNKVMEDGYTGNWILEAGDKKFVFTGVVNGVSDDEWFEKI